MTHVAYYCSGHGFGHATRVAEVSRGLLDLGLSVTIVTQAPTLPFSTVLGTLEADYDDKLDTSVKNSTISSRKSSYDEKSPSLNDSADAISPCSSSRGSCDNISVTTSMESINKHHFAMEPPSVETPSISPTPRVRYRYAEIDAGVVQPKAYDVDRKATLDNLKAFLSKRTEKLSHEKSWILDNNVEIVLSDACFLGCAAAKEAGVPSALITNFTFDSCYSYLAQKNVYQLGGLNDDTPLDESVLHPIVEKVINDYKCSDALIRLPGYIPIPAFDTDVPKQSSTWVDTENGKFVPTIETILNRPTSQIPAGPHRQVIQAPMLSRPPSRLSHTREFKYSSLSTLNIPKAFHDHHVLLVSFGGQFIPPPCEGAECELLASDTFLPPGWIALVCEPAKNKDSFRRTLPQNFYSCPSDAYLPDLTAVADVILGKLGYGTCSEALAASTPMIHVPRPMFVEEYGLKRWMQRDGALVSMTREQFETGQWSKLVLDAHSLGSEMKNKFRTLGYKHDEAANIIAKMVLQIKKEHQ